MTTTNSATGSKYEQTKNLRGAEISKLMRADIKTAIKAGELPEGIKCSVRYESFSGGCAIRIRVTAVPAGFVYWRSEYIAHEVTSPRVHFDGERVTDEAKRVLEVLRKIHGAYNYDRSDIQSDYFNVRFYGDAGFGYEVTGADRERQEAALSSAA